MKIIVQIQSRKQDLYKKKDKSFIILKLRIFLESTVYKFKYTYIHTL